MLQCCSVTVSDLSSDTNLGEPGTPPEYFFRLPTRNNKTEILGMLGFRDTVHREEDSESPEV